jgi:hypothetical protein
MDSGTRKIVFLWITGGVLSVLALWGITAVTVNSRAEQVFDAELGRVVFRPTSVRQYRTEGWATTHYGRYGIPGIPDGTRLPGQKVMIWGDSHVEAQEVEDNQKTAVVANNLWFLRHASNTVSFISWGESGACFANHCFDIPRYERVFPGPAKHYIVMSFTRRAFPNDLRSASALFLEEGGNYKIVEKPVNPPSARSVAWRQRVTRARLHVFFKLYEKLSISTITQLRFKVGPVPRVALERELPPFDLAYTTRGFTWIMRELKQKTSTPISVVYIPEVPKIVTGRIVFDPHELDAEEASRKDVFRSVCQSEGIGFIDLTETFCDVVRKSHAFPRGFGNTRPSEGHLNALGNQLVAEAVIADVEASLP